MILNQLEDESEEDQGTWNGHTEKDIITIMTRFNIHNHLEHNLI